MKSKLAGVGIVLAILVMALGIVGQASAGGITDTIIKDAGDGTLDGNYTAAQIQAALAYLSDNPIATQYSGSQGVLSRTTSPACRLRVRRAAPSRSRAASSSLSSGSAPSFWVPVCSCGAAAAPLPEAALIDRPT